MAINFILQKSTTKTEFLTGESIVFTIKYSNPSTTDDALNVIITDQLPSNLEYISAVTSTDVASYSFDALTNKVTFNMISPLPAGSSGILKITAQFPIGTSAKLPNGDPNSALNTVNATGSNINPIPSSVTVYPENIDPDWSISKDILIPQSVAPAVSSIVEYGITLHPNSFILGAADLNNVILTDILPISASFLNASSPGVYSSTLNTVTWNLGTIPPSNSTIEETVSVIYPGDVVSITDTVLNTVSATGNVIGSSPTTVSASLVHGFTSPIIAIPQISKYTRTTNDRYSVGQDVVFFIDNIGNAGNTPLQSLTVSDVLPVDIEWDSFTTGQYSGADGILSVYYQTNLSPLQLWPSSPFPITSNTTLYVSDLNLDPSDFITEIEYEYTNGSDGISSAFQQTYPILLNGTISSAVSVSTVISNTAQLVGYSPTYGSVTTTDDTSITIIDPTPWLQNSKYFPSGVVNYSPGATIQYEFDLKNHVWATGDLVDPIGVDVLPSELTSIANIIAMTTFAPNITSVLIDPNYIVTISSVTSQAIKVIGYGYLSPGDYITVAYDATLSPSSLNGFIANDLYFSAYSPTATYENPISELIQDIYDINGNGSTTDYLLPTSLSTYVDFVGNLDSVKWVKGELDTVWTKYPAHGETLPGGIANYEIHVENNDSNGPIGNITIIDILPHIGDVGVLDPQPRGSDWTPYLVNIITGPNGATLPSDVTIYYSTNPNPSRIELLDPNAPLVPSDGWSTTPPEDITTVQSLKFTFGSLVINMGEEVILEWPMRAPLGAPVNEFAWNSFGYIASYNTYTGSDYFLPSEPIKVGFQINPDPANAYSIGQYVWQDINYNGIQDDGLDSGINDVLVNLYQIGNPTRVGYTRTGYDQNNNPGYYEFPYLSIGSYEVEFIYPQTYQYTLNRVGTLGLNSNIEPSTLTTTTDLGYPAYSVKSPTIVISSTNNFDINLGLILPATFGNYVWEDLNYNGLYDSGEPYVPGVTVNLLDSTGQPVLDINSVPISVTTDLTGHYLIGSITPGTYIAQFINPNSATYTFTTPNVGTNPNINSKALSTGKTNPFFLSSGETNLEINAGLILIGSIGSFVWFDTNHNGIRDPGELGVPNVTVQLLDANGNVIKTQQTSDTGNYLFSDLPFGTYSVRFVKSTLPAGYLFTLPYVGTNPAINSHANPTTGETEQVTLTATDPNQLNLNAGIYNALTLDTSVALLIVSIGMEEMALAHVFNAEGEKLQAAISGLTSSQISITQLLEANTSVEEVLDEGATLQLTWDSKLETALSILKGLNC